ncbi:MAG: hypothetical protein J6V99_07055 [Neisseriaceae bacterium]|nr:hypothetical protein [Neisseriaceae bacterium]
MMKDFTHITQTQNIQDDEAVNTLDTVFNQWQSGQQVIEWKVIPIASPDEVARREKMLKLTMYSGSLMILVVALLSVITMNLGTTLSIIFLGICVAFAIGESLFLLPLLLKAARKNLINARIVKINRNKKIATITHQQQTKKMKYGSQGVIPAFRLPENNRSQYEQKRASLQQQITAETGFVFEETV